MTHTVSSHIQVEWAHVTEQCPRRNACLSLLDATDLEAMHCLHLWNISMYLDQILAMYAPCISLSYHRSHPPSTLAFNFLQVELDLSICEMASSQLSGGRIQRDILSPNAMQINTDRVTCI